MMFRVSAFSIWITILLSVGYFTSSDGAIPPLRTYRITCDSTQLAYIVTNYWLDQYIPCTFSGDSGTAFNAEIRIRGESSREYPKKSFKVNFFAPYRYENRDKINLVSEWTDPTFVREYLSYDLFRRAGLLAPNVVFVRLIINERYAGLYCDIEQVGDTFLDQRGLDPSAPIYKAAENQTNLLSGEIEGGLWERENGDQTNFSELRNLINWLKDVPQSQFYEVLDSRFDRLNLARSIAVNSLIGNTSTYYHNYFLVKFRGEGGRWEYIPWDVDKTFIYRSSYSDPPYCRSGHQNGGTNELIRRCWLDPDMQQLIFDQIKSINDSLFVSDYYSDITDSLRHILSSAVEADTAKQFTINDFHLSMDLVPQDVEGRGRLLSGLVDIENRLPLPFDLYPAHITSDGVLFNWSAASISDGDAVTYDLQVARDFHFSAPEWGVNDLRGTSAILSNVPVGKLYWRVIARDSQNRWLGPLQHFSVLETSEFDHHRIDVPYSITGQRRLRPDQGIYRATRDMVVEAGGVLEIERGVRIQFADSARLMVKGKLKIVDAVGDSVRLEPIDPAIGWGGIVIEPEGEAELSFLAIRDASGLSGSGGLSPAIFVDQNSHVSIKNSTIYARGAYGSAIDCFSSSIILENCKFFGSNSLVRINDGDVALISDCEFTGGDYSNSAQLLIEYQSGAIEIEKSRFSAGKTGVRLSVINSANISRCKFEELDDEAISTIKVNHCNVSNSIFVYSGSGLGLNYSNMDVWNCNFMKNRTIFNIGNESSHSITNSVFWHTTILVSYNTEVLKASYCLSDLPLPGIGNILGSPQFEKPWDGDFTPEAGSPLIDAGTADGAPTTDYFGRSRLNTPGQKNNGAGRYKYYDIGAVEYPVGDATPPAMNGRVMYIYPNPFNDRAEVIFVIEIGGRANIELFDVAGRNVASRHFEQITAGQYRVSVEELMDGGELPAGIYFCRLDQPSDVTMTKLIVLR